MGLRNNPQLSAALAAGDQVEPEGWPVSPKVWAFYSKSICQYGIVWYLIIYIYNSIYIHRDRDLFLYLLRFYLFIRMYVWLWLCMSVCLNPPHGVINVVPPFGSLSQETVCLPRLHVSSLVWEMCASPTLKKATANLLTHTFPIAAYIAGRHSERNCSQRCQ